jgi:hypothetical protein
LGIEYTHLRELYGDQLEALAATAAELLVVLPVDLEDKDAVVGGEEPFARCRG